MSGMFGVVADGQSGLFRLQQARKPWEKELEGTTARSQLSRKADRAQAAGFSLSPDQMRDHAAALTAMEEARRVGGPKAAAEQRLEEVERKIEELKLAMRFAHGDREKLAQLAREAAMLAREAGRAAKDYGTGIANAAEMGLPGGAWAPGSTEITRTTTTTSLTVRQTEVALSLTVTSGSTPAAGVLAAAGDASADAIPAGAASADAVSADADRAAADAEADAAADGDGAGLLPEDLAELVNGVLSHLGTGGLSGAGRHDRRALMQQLIADNDMKLSRFREADGFARRVEAVLGTARTVIGEAKAANMLDELEERRKARREAFKGYDKVLEEAQKSVDGLRQAAFGSSLSAEALLAAPGGNDAGGEVAFDGMGAAGSAADTGGDPGTVVVNMLA
ncbi:hypothetical protein [Azospirillum thermophilum]|uniref:hypothetical protein n=1 Tax=Azospirillum thermophilum TaxID=2202148 RepID=UPI0015E8D57F|nr:hypothetical protein [Azospirillum thermophilum]